MTGVVTSWRFFWHLHCFVMDPSDHMATINHNMEAVALNDDAAPEGSAKEQNTSAVDLLRMKQQMYNQCFEIKVQLQAGKIKESRSTSEPERHLPACVNNLERVRTDYFNSTLILHRMQMWHAIREKLKQNDSQADALIDVGDRCMASCSRINQLQNESRALQDEIREIQKKRLEMKRLTHEKLKEVEELMSKKEHPDIEKYKAALAKGQENLEKYKKLTVITQNVLRGILLACQINWLDDPKLRDIAMTLDEFPIPD
uniref:centromere protein H isoform X1 n=1 Tax=Monopterus albus TaxID=43700 RepID=UPI0009B33AA5|nr:centromere protein H isoform X1 [Monopterus albus]